MRRGDYPEVEIGPTDERLNHAGPYYQQTGKAKSARRTTMLDDALGRAWMRQKITAAEYAALRKYALHWLGAGLQGCLPSVDLNRIAGPASGLAGSERQVWHSQQYRSARHAIGRRPAFVADQVACNGLSLKETGILLGYKSLTHGREQAAAILADAGYRLEQHWSEVYKRR